MKTYYSPYDKRNKTIGILCWCDRDIWTLEMEGFYAVGQPGGVNPKSLSQIVKFDTMEEAIDWLNDKIKLQYVAEEFRKTPLKDTIAKREFFDFGMPLTQRRFVKFLGELATAQDYYTYEEMYIIANEFWKSIGNYEELSKEEFSYKFDFMNEDCS